ncbi:hypothetical protein [Pontibacter anaerobius]|uniref:Uncharacterized protein n=1 Tax=Pontibacter anaerobius TaxID=2993940 RepID=A0ABT3RKL1_9BACT|nr:hypothetical protein [Pontibacter anaerobius]MCX2741730.1 hypothetical protein [Pontibacter anaerobius]
MNLNLFNTHTLAGRLEIIWARGNFIANRGRRGYRIELYDLGSFFAEIWYNPENDYISLVRGFTSKKALEPYITQVDLMEMFDW